MKRCVIPWRNNYSLPILINTQQISVYIGTGMDTRYQSLPTEQETFATLPGGSPKQPAGYYHPILLAQKICRKPAIS